MLLYSKKALLGFFCGATFFRIAMVLAAKDTGVREVLHIGNPKLPLYVGEQMSEGTPRGNNPEQWTKLLELLDEKLQLGLLDKLRRVNAYHFEASVLIIEPASEDDVNYLRKPATNQQLVVFAQDATGVTDIQIKSS